MVFTETDRIEREERRAMKLEAVAVVLCPRCGITVTLRNGDGACGMCGRHPHENTRTELRGMR